MPPHLHPRSRMTSSLFATTVAVSFFVVALPHILPCPAPRVTYADAPANGTVVVVEQNEDGTTTTTTRQLRRRRKVAPASEGKDLNNSEDLARLEALASSGAAKTVANESTTVRLGAIEETFRTRDRECPMPKPGGVLGELLSYVNSSTKSETSTSLPLSPEEQSRSIPRPPPESRPAT
ncbi:hypothetical protein Micbo1qcDRAFT_157265 [Microdochium bolleyi]|uniref:Alpha-1,3-mannosyltransferase n=1 Tax=Microdochium bolleyi TaxID=196109 RepID=A0A136JDX0_9PEZI|nr:hypothetical protein Micbo1qcDRAFT_157265 [Microdochium bolleyi]